MKQSIKARVLQLVKQTKKESDSVFPALNQEKALKFVQLYNKFYSKELPKPYIFPLQDEEGLNIEFERYKEEWCELDVRFEENFKSTFYFLNKENEEHDKELELDLSTEKGWQALNKELFEFFRNNNYWHE